MKDEWRIKATNSLKSRYIPLVFRTKKEAEDEIERRKRHGFTLGGETYKAVQVRLVEAK